MTGTALIAMVMGMLGASSALKVTSPSEGTKVIADRTYTVEWDGTSDDNRFVIDLYYCGSMCSEDDCGDWVTALCAYGEEGCIERHDNEGDLDVVFPEPLRESPGIGYKVRVMDIDDEEDANCSEEFELIATEDVPDLGDSDDQAYMTVNSPHDGESATAGDMYTIEYDYNNEVGSKVDRFAIDLYLASGDDDCGTYYTSLCDKPDIGCKDSMGDYDVKIPDDTPAGEYKVRVGRFTFDDSETVVYGCSGTFNIESDYNSSSSGDDESSFNGTSSPSSSSSGDEGASVNGTSTPSFSSSGDEGASVNGTSFPNSSSSGDEGASVNGTSTHSSSSSGDEGASVNGTSTHSSSSGGASVNEASSGMSYSFTSSNGQ